MRLSEALGLAKEDIKLDEPIPYIRLIPHPWRRLKTRSSQRYIPPSINVMLIQQVQL